jgi:hypothetical protein
MTREQQDELVKVAFDKHRIAFDRAVATWHRDRPEDRDLVVMVNARDNGVLIGTKLGAIQFLKTYPDQDGVIKSLSCCDYQADPHASCLVHFVAFSHERDLVLVKHVQVYPAAKGAA